MTYQKILRHGSSLAVVIRAEWCHQLGFKRGDWVSVEAVNANLLLIKKAAPPPLLPSSLSGPRPPAQPVKDRIGKSKT